MSFTTTPNSGRRSLLQAALASASTPLFIRHAFAADTIDRFALGLASGCPRPSGMVLWTRLTGAELPPNTEVSWELAEDEAFTRIAARGVEQAVVEDAHSVHAEATGLEADRWYFYRFSALGARSMVGRTRTAPAADAEVKELRFAIASCQRWDHGRYAAWADMAKQDLDLVLFLGDYIYEYGAVSNASASGPAPRVHVGGLCRTLPEYRQRYAQYKSDPALQAMHARAPWIITWDDHEVDNDWAGDSSQGLEADFPARRAASAKAYWEHMPFTKAMRPKGHEIRIHERYDWGKLARIITLDCRQYRDPQVCPKPGRGGSNTLSIKDCPAFLDPKRSFLGEAQEQWLAQSWDAARPWNLLAQSTLMAQMNWQENPAQPRVHWTDGWDGYPAARNRLLQGLADKKLPNAVVLGGDVHANYVTDLKLDFNDAKSRTIATEFCGTSITSQGLDQQRIDRARPHNPHIHYGRGDQHGYMSFKLQANRLEAELRSVRNLWEADSEVEVSARFAVEAGRPGAIPLDLK
ncbi:alkaline phosphatase D family protein [Roseateles oligotrophus]|uniref:Alkaline phosphatase D family protein n=1 Tax=Roseateles oligotrophus TaxID=1769250 RepID=A0ABT2YF23_9BURK|nr:alkaline phosphatase D family protein [Roseateles oligotrophus]MCV2368623.1 alkaline phosphatase D family protein [Roseateles oligotrophus]